MLSTSFSTISQVRRQSRKGRVRGSLGDQANPTADCPLVGEGGGAVGDGTDASGLWAFGVAVDLWSFGLGPGMEVFAGRQCRNLAAAFVPGRLRVTSTPADSVHGKPPGYTKTGITSRVRVVDNLKSQRVTATGKWEGVLQPGCTRRRRAFLRREWNFPCVRRWGPAGCPEGGNQRWSLRAKTRTATWPAPGSGTLAGACCRNVASLLRDVVYCPPAGPAAAVGAPASGRAQLSQRCPLSRWGGRDLSSQTGRSPSAFAFSENSCTRLR